MRYIMCISVSSRTLEKCEHEREYQKRKDDTNSPRHQAPRIMI